MTQQQQTPQDRRILESVFPDYKPRPVQAWVRKSGLGRSPHVLSALHVMGGTVERLEAVGGEQVVPILLWFRENVPQVRRWGHKAALALLVWRMGKYQTKGPVGDRTRAARRYVTHVQSAWLSERQAMGQA